MPVIADANVLIDYAGSDITILSLYSTEIETVVIPESILDEVEQLSLEECEHFGLTVINEDLEILTLASNSNHGPLSFQDKVCLYLTKSIEGATCITNEKALKKICESEAVPVKRGLKLMIELVEQQKIEPDVVVGVAEQIHDNNPFFITTEILDDFRCIIEAIRI